MLKSSFIVFALLLLSACATVKPVVVKESTATCYVSAGIYVMKFSLQTQSPGCFGKNLPSQFEGEPFRVEPKSLPCGRKFMTASGNRALLILDFVVSGAQGRLGVSDGKCTIVYSVFVTGVN